MTQKTYIRSFAAGEIAPTLFGRLDLAKFQTGLAKCLNFRVTPQGPVENRPGFKFVRAAKFGNKRSVLIPFSYSSTQTFALEFGDGYIRFHTLGATLLSGGVPYEIASPYAEADLFDLHYVQSADVLTIVHPSYQQRELRRLGPTSWQLSAVSFGTNASTPATPTATASGPGGGFPSTLEYGITSVKAGGEEAILSGIATASTDLSVAGNRVTITAANPPEVLGAVALNVYKRNGSFGFIGSIGLGQTTFTDDNIQPDVTQGPPASSNPFTSDYPRAVSYYEQRRAFAGTTLFPQNLYLTRSGTESNMNSSTPTRDDDAITARVVAREANTIRHLVPMGDLLALTSGGVWRVSSTDSGALTPSSISVRPQSYVGASNVAPMVTSQSVLYVADRGSHVQEVSYRWETQSYQSDDVSVLAPHLFDYQTVVQLAYSKAPLQTLWAVRDDGILLGLTHMPEHEVKAWHQHSTQGAFESVCAVAEGTEDGVYVIVRRVINGATVRYIERMQSRRFTTLADSFFVDAGLTYSGAPATTISGLGHLEGATVAILADGGVEPRQVVTGGQVALSAPASKVHIGLPYDCDLQTLPLAFEAPGLGQGNPKNINKVQLRVLNSSGVKAGPTFSKLRSHPTRSLDDVYGAPPAPVTGVIDLRLDPLWQDNGQVCIRQSDPVPLTVLSMALETAGG